MKKNTESIGKEKMTDQELSDAFGRYQRRESIGILLGALLVIAGVSRPLCSTMCCLCAYRPSPGWG